MEIFKKPQKTYSTEYIIKKSKFLSYLSPIETFEHAYKTLDEKKKKNYKANHHPFCIIFSKREKISDDGEPSGTAGKPILNIVNKNNIVDSILIVFRYFGGIKLGASGLIRAYSNAAIEVIKISKFYRKKFISKYFIKTNYKDYNNLKYLLLKFNPTEFSEKFLNYIEINISIEKDIETDLLKTLKIFHDQISYKKICDIDIFI